MRRSFTLLACVLMVLVPSSAWAQQTNAPPGNSGVDEYLESIPAAGGNKPSGGAVNGRPQRLSPKEREALKSAGGEAAALERVVAATKPSAARKPARRTPPTAAEDPGKGRSPLSAVVRAAAGDDGDGMGLLLPGILIGALLATLAVVALRFTRGRPTS